MSDNTCRKCSVVLTAENRYEPKRRRLICTECRNTQVRNRYQPKGRPERSGPAPAPARDGDKRQARKRVNQLVLCGKLPRPNSLPCVDCGHVWAEGQRRHEYDHFRGYVAAHHLDVQAVCTTCHGQRIRDRGEYRRAS